jgi:hypothetical protein
MTALVAALITDTVPSSDLIGSNAFVEGGRRWFVELLDRVGIRKGYPHQPLYQLGRRFPGKARVSGGQGVHILNHAVTEAWLNARPKYSLGSWKSMYCLRRLRLWPVRAE